MYAGEKESSWRKPHKYRRAKNREGIRVSYGYLILCLILVIFESKAVMIYGRHFNRIIDTVTLAYTQPASILTTLSEYESISINGVQPGVSEDILRDT
jgi:hypothetical protein